MGRLGRVMFAGTLATGLLGCTAHGRAAGSDVTPTVEALPYDPDGDSGGIGWTVRPAGRTPPQAGYRLVVSTDPYAVDTITRGGVDPNAWDSGLVHSTRHTGIRPPGFRFESGATCYWTVRIRDTHGHDSPWSPTSQWTTHHPAPAATEDRANPSSPSGA